MVSFKLLATIFCAFLIFQAEAARLDSQLEVRDDFLDTIKKVVTSVEKIVDSVLSFAIQELEKIDSNMDNVIANSAEIFDKIVDRVSARVEQVMNKVSEDGDDNTKAVVKCVLAGHEHLATIIKSLYDSTTTCSSADFSKIVESLKPVIADLQKTQVDVKAAADKINDCTDLSCVLSVAQGVLAAIKEIPDVVSPDVKAAIEVIRTAFKDNHDTCLKPFVTELKKSIVDIGNEIGTCVRA